MKKVLAVLVVLIFGLAVFVGIKGYKKIEPIIEQYYADVFNEKADESKDENKETEQEKKIEENTEELNDTAGSSTAIESNEKATEKRIVDYISEDYSQTNDYKYGIKLTSNIRKNFLLYSDGSKELSNISETKCYDTSGYRAEDSELMAEAELMTNANWGYYAEVLRLVNEIRASVSVEPLSLDKSLCEAATVRALEMNYSSVFEHKRPDGRDFFTVFESLGIVYGAAGENIAAGQSTPEEVVAAWKSSPAHYENMINEQYKILGVGMSDEEIDDYGIYWELLFKD